MKKIETIIDNCKDCSFCLRYKHPQECRGTAFICDDTNPQRLIVIDKSVERIDIPDWCPLETYKEAEKPEAQPAANPSTIILSGMPGLEWMTENLSGFGGTEIDGNTYYTWEEAMAAAEQLGDGWRLPTRDEFVQLDELGSVWVEDGPHGLPGRLFGGNHKTDHKDSLFMSAAGCRSNATGALANVGAYGYSWSSSPYVSTGSNAYNAGMLHFNSTNVNPLSNGYRAIARAVRCVRNRQ